MNSELYSNAQFIDSLFRHVGLRICDERLTPPAERRNHVGATPKIDGNRVLLSFV